jgi:hypothetical protein
VIEAAQSRDKQNMERRHGEKTSIGKSGRLLEEAEYEKRSRKRTGDFTRNRKTPFKKLIWSARGKAGESPRKALERFSPKRKEAVHMRWAGVQPGA